jgi:methyltransferase-like protein
VRFCAVFSFLMKGSDFMSSDGLNAYDEMPYVSLPVAQSHPARLFAIGRLFGMQPVVPQEARVLELGCASGGNLLGIAAAYPQSQCVGVDASARQIAQGRELVDALGLKHCDLRCASILDIGPDWGKFDYIIAHGVWSWVEAPVREKILAVCRDHLSAQGIALVSYNALPGWHLRGAIREMMRWHTAGVAEGAEKAKAARALLQFLATATAEDKNLWGQILRGELQMLSGQPDWYLLHDHLESVNHPVYFFDFMQQAAGHDLQYLGDAEVASMMPTGLAPDVVTALHQAAPDIVRMEQYLDFLRNRTFRQTLLVGQSVTLNRHIDFHSLAGLFVASPLQWGGAAQPGRPVRLTHPNGQFADVVTPLTQAALLELAQVWPQAVKFEDLVGAARQRLEASPLLVPDPAHAAAATQAIGDDLAQLYLNGLIELRADALQLSQAISSSPKAFSLAQMQASRALMGEGAAVTNLRHEVIPLDPFYTRLLALLNGAHDRPALLAALQPAFEQGQLSVLRDGKPITDAVVLRGRLVSLLDEALRLLRAKALLVA